MLMYFFYFFNHFFMIQNLFLNYKIINNVQVIRLINKENIIVIATGSFEIF